MNCIWSRRISLALVAVASGLLGVGFATGPASADSSADPLSWSDELLSGVSVPAQTSALDMQVSIDGIDLFSTVGNTATANSDKGDIAIAIGDGADANAFGGEGNVAFADGADSVAMAGGSFTYPFPLFGAEYFTFPDNFDIAYVVGSDSTAIAGGGNEALSSFDLAAVSGDLLDATANGGNFLTDIVPSV
jgi:hypothetical protein